MAASNEHDVLLFGSRVEEVEELEKLEKLRHEFNVSRATMSALGINWNPFKVGSIRLKPIEVGLPRPTGVKGARVGKNLRLRLGNGSRRRRL